MLRYKVLLFLASQLALTHMTCSYRSNLVGHSSYAIADKLYSSLAQINKDNVLISPVSIDYSLAALALGANSKSYEELLEAMNLPTDDHTVLKTAFKEHAKSMENDKNVTIATKLFIDDKFKVKESYKNQLMKMFNSTVGKVHFNDTEKTRNTINQWVEKETNNKITDLIKKDDGLSSAVAVLVNAIYFNAAWMHPFDPKSTKEQTFYALDGEIKVDMMELEQEFDYKFDTDCNAHLVLLPYEGEYGMLLAVPDKKDGINDLENCFFARSFVHPFMSDKKKSKISLNMPKFTLEVTTALKDVLNKIGVNSIFTRGALTNATSDNDVFISSILQKTYLKVDEKNTEGGGATEVVYSNSMPIAVKADHPFMFVVLHKTLEVIIFIGRYMNNK